MTRFLTALLALAAASMHAPATPAAVPDFAEMDRHFRIMLEAERVPGAAWAVVRDGRIVHAAGHGVRSLDDQRSVTPETVFRVASVSKTFAAQLTGQLVAEGRLHWDDPVRRYVPQFTLARAEHAQKLTIEHLLSQSAGIVPNAYDNLLNAGRTLEEILPQFGNVAPVCPPGECYTYQNVLFSLVEPAIEASSGRSYADLLRERVFEPLDMRQASVGHDEFLASSNRASPHVKVNRWRWVPTQVNENYYRVAPAAGVNASALDLGRWLAAHMGNRPDVIRPQVVAGLTRKRVRTARELRRKGWRDLLSDAHYGLGWRIYSIDGQPLITHSGWVKGFVAQVAYSPEHRTGLALLLNAESGAINDLSIHFWQQALAEPPMVASRAASPSEAAESSTNETSVVSAPN
ncbi:MULTISPECIES: serine hydrolase [unclassified Wenzhouxiangella]|uniref:serine hydrolase domain-containing protein n=1 Tax=unclassified Wenzhouxiangella TaxID=2613841 RepID=UPI000E328E65|nr:MULTISPECIES: serine hydrolase domain-containing protein [unclassified Wenzhouxiangella]RFF28823.1 class A beta-lactamase-related serine hydrolase [Wenzhouxiangella sp. 15181]RFP68200.1 class A beta-lactamase-related serine hydrolase [Wenzhouxiangella sp. 15190]